MQSSSTCYCPKCHKGIMVEKYGKTGVFYACPRFKEGCRTTLSVKNYKIIMAGGQIEEKPKVPARYTPKPVPRGQSTPELLKGTPQQEKIWKTFATGKSIIVDALAGSGKTTTIVQALARADQTEHYIVVAYNSKIRDELLAKLPRNATALTIHQVCYRAVMAAFGYLKPTKYKVRNILADLYKLESQKDDDVVPLRIAILTAERIVSLCKNYMIFNPNSEDINGIIDDFGMDVQNLGLVQEMVLRIMDIAHLEDTIRKYSIDFDDQIYIAIRYGLPLMQCAAVFADEAQDLSPLRKEAILRMSRQIIAVGDSHQAIYRFSGADANSMDNIHRALPEAVYLPLSVNFRCGVKHIELAQVLVPEIEAHAAALPGHVHEITSDVLFDIVKPGDMVICRANAPMIAYVYKLLKEGKPATIVGRDFGEELEHLVERLSSKTHNRKDKQYVSITDFMIKLDDYLQSELDKLSKKKKNTGIEEAERLRDRVDCIHVLLDGCKEIPDLLGKIQDMFSEEDVSGNPNIILFYTAHKSKGLERSRVFIIEPQLLPHPKAISEADQQQELNLLYVAITRVHATTQTDGRLFFVGAMPTLLREKCEHLITPYTEGASMPVMENEDRVFVDALLQSIKEQYNVQRPESLTFWLSSNEELLGTSFVFGSGNKSRLFWVPSIEFNEAGEEIEPRVYAYANRTDMLRAIKPRTGLWASYTLNTDSVLGSRWVGIGTGNYDNSSIDRFKKK